MTDATPVVIFDGISAHPVFHMHARWVPGLHPVELGDGRMESRSKTLCGLTIWRATWRPSPSGGQGYESVDTPHARLRLDQARSFGRLCQRCERTA